VAPVFETRSTAKKIKLENRIIVDGSRLQVDRGLTCPLVSRRGGNI
jgi:hypothetical protein